MSSNNEQNHVNSEEIIKEMTTNLEINTNENHIESDQATEKTVTNTESNVNELPIESDHITITEEINEPSLTINDNNNEIVENRIVRIYIIQS
jgi:hypothetical protein